MQKEEYIKYVTENYENESKELLLKQIELFFKKVNINKNKYNKGDEVF